MKRKEPSVTRLDYCQYLLNSQISYTVTNFADRTEKFSYDTINRFLAGEKITPRLVWENVQGQVAQSPKGYFVFDDTICAPEHWPDCRFSRRAMGGASAVLIYLGWITVAAVANVTDVLDYLQWNGFGIAPEIWMSMMLAFHSLSAVSAFSVRCYQYLRIKMAQSTLVLSTGCANYGRCENLKGWNGLFRTAIASSSPPRLKNSIKGLY